MQFKWVTVLMHQLHCTFEQTFESVHEEVCIYLFIFKCLHSASLERQFGKSKTKQELQKSWTCTRVVHPRQQAAGSVSHIQSVERVIFSFQTLAPACGKFAPFEIKENVSLAPLCRVQCEESALEELDRCLLNQSDDGHTLKDWIGQKPRRSGPTKPRRSKSLR